MIQLNNEEKIIDWKERISACWLQAIPHISRQKLVQLRLACGNAQEMLLLKETQLQQYLSFQEIYLWQQFQKEKSPYQVYEELQKKNISYVSFCEDSFPKKLKNIPDAPFGIYYRGKLPEQNKPTVAIVGARKCSDYGKCMTKHFAKKLAMSGISIISGMAIGIDSYGQWEAIHAGGDSYAVLGCGVDIVYPPSNRELYDKLLMSGGIISEYPPGTNPLPRLFPPRNRLISGLSDALLVTEAREKSGTSITVDMALEQGKEVFVVPGRCTDPLSAGCNRLLRQGAAAALEPEDILEDMHWKDMLEQDMSEVKMVENSALSDIARDIYGVLEVDPMTQDEILSKLYQKNKKYPVTQVFQGLLELELMGISQRTYGQYKLSCKKK